MTASVLILGSPSDPHEQSVTNHLRRKGVNPTFWSAPELLKTCALVVEISDDDFDCRVEEPGDQTASKKRTGFSFTGFSSVWLRRPGKVESRALPESWMSGFVERESNRALNAIYRMLSPIWVNDPIAEQNSRLKLTQLQAAKQCGLNIPETLVTNKPESVRRFYDLHSGEVIYKLIDEASNLLFPKHEVPPGIVTTPFRESDLQHLDQVRFSLHLFQRRIPKTCDIRITIVGADIFAVRIDSQAGAGTTDFRLDYSVPLSVHKLPTPVADGCRRLMTRLGLVYGAIDMCMDADGKYYFFEVNSSGQWLWMEEKLDLPISLKLADLLAP